MHSSIANTRYGLHVQMSEPKTSEPLPMYHMLHVDDQVFEIGRKIRGTDIHHGHGESVPLIHREQKRGFRLERRFQHLL